MKKVFTLFLISLIVFNYQISTASILDDLGNIDINTPIQMDNPVNSVGFDVYDTKDLNIANGSVGIVATLIGIATNGPIVIVNALVTVVNSVITPFAGITTIIYGTADIFQLSFFSQPPTVSLSNAVYGFVSGVYSALRYLAILIYIVMLAYLAIRMLLSSLGKQKALYKTLLKHWFVGLLLLSVGHYIMAYIIWISNIFVRIFYDFACELIGGELTELHLLISTTIFNANAATMIFPVVGGMVALAVTFAYLGVNIAVIWTYVKRFFIISFLITIYPLVSITYVFDKMGDRKAQTFGKWLHEFATNVAIQPFHAIALTFILVIYNKMALFFVFPFIGTILAILLLLLLFKVEKLLKELFQLNSSMGGASFAQSGAGLIAAASLGKQAFGAIKDNKQHLLDSKKAKNALNDFVSGKTGKPRLANGKEVDAFEVFDKNGRIKDQNKFNELSDDDRKKYNELKQTYNQASRLAAYENAGAAMGGGLLLGAGGGLTHAFAGIALGDTFANVAAGRLAKKDGLKGIEEERKKLLEIANKIGDDGSLANLDLNEKKALSLGLGMASVESLAVENQSKSRFSKKDIISNIEHLKRAEKNGIEYGKEALESGIMTAPMHSRKYSDLTDEQKENATFFQDRKNAYINLEDGSDPIMIAGAGDETLDPGTISKEKYVNMHNVDSNKIVTANVKKKLDEEVLAGYYAEGSEDYNKARQEYLKEAKKTQKDVIRKIYSQMPSIYKSVAPRLPSGTTPETPIVDAEETYEPGLSMEPILAIDSADLHNRDWLAMKGITGVEYKESVNVYEKEFRDNLRSNVSDESNLPDFNNMSSKQIRNNAYNLGITDDFLSYATKKAEEKQVEVLNKLQGQNLLKSNSVRKVSMAKYDSNYAAENFALSDIKVTNEIVDMGKEGAVTTEYYSDNTAIVRSVENPEKFVVTTYEGTPPTEGHVYTKAGYVDGRNLMVSNDALSSTDLSSILTSTENNEYVPNSEFTDLPSEFNPYLSSGNTQRAALYDGYICLLDKNDNIVATKEYVPTNSNFSSFTRQVVNLKKDSATGKYIISSTEDGIPSQVVMNSLLTRQRARTAKNDSIDNTNNLRETFAENVYKNNKST